jgi:hypothetical protein
MNISLSADIRADKGARGILSFRLNRASLSRKGFMALVSSLQTVFFGIKQDQWTPFFCRVKAIIEIKIKEKGNGRVVSGH